MNGRDPAADGLVAAVACRVEAHAIEEDLTAAWWNRLPSPNGAVAQFGLRAISGAADEGHPVYDDGAGEVVVALADIAANHRPGRNLVTRAVGGIAT